MPIAELVLDNPTKEFERFYIKVKDQHTNLLIYSASIEESPRLLKEVGDLPGLYILQAEDSTVYVGQSKALGARLKTHRTARKIGFNRILAMVRDQSLAQYLDFAEAKIFEELHKRGFKLEQSSLSGSLETKRRRLAQQDNEHVRTAEIHVLQFLTYAVALGLAKPASHRRSEATKAATPGRNVELQTRDIVPVQSAQEEVLPVAPNGGAVLPQTSGVLRVKTSAGDEVAGASATDVYVTALIHLGLERVAKLPFMLAGAPLVGRAMPKQYAHAAKRVGAFYIPTHSNTQQKAAMLRRVSESLAAHLTVEYDKPNTKNPTEGSSSVSAEGQARPATRIRRFEVRWSSGTGFVEVRPEGIFVCAGSKAKVGPVLPTSGPAYQRLWNDAVTQGLLPLAEDKRAREVAADIEVRNASQAASLILAAETGGPTRLIDVESGKSWKEVFSEASP